MEFLMRLRQSSQFFFSIVIFSASIGCGIGGRMVEPEGNGFVSLKPESWSILYSQDMPGHPSGTTDGAWAMPLPSSSGHLNYVKTPYSPTKIATQVKVTFRVDSSSDVIYDSVDPAARNPATFHLFLERRGDDLTKPNYRWWSGDGGYTLGSQDNSTVTITVPLRPEYWTNVNGQCDATEFNQTLQDLAFVGMTFGGQDSWGHGVNLKSGAARFTLVDYSLE
jgi:hypothetical protein